MYWAGLAVLLALFVAAALVPVLCIAERLRLPGGRGILLAAALAVAALMLMFVLPVALRSLAAVLALPPLHLLAFAGVSGVFQEIAGRRLELTPVLFIKRENAIDFAFTQVALWLSLLISGVVITSVRP